MLSFCNEVTEAIEGVDLAIGLAETFAASDCRISASDIFLLSYFDGSFRDGQDSRPEMAKLLLVV